MVVPNEQKCRTCFVLVDRSLPRCPKCGAHQNWRRHLTLLNVMATGVVLMMVVALMFILPFFSRTIQPRTGAALKVGFSVVGTTFVAQVRITNEGDRALLINQVHIAYKDSSGLARNYMRLVEPGENPVSVAAHATNLQTLAFAKGPGVVQNPVTRVVVMHDDGSTQVLVDSVESMLSSRVGPRPLAQP